MAARIFPQGGGQDPKGAAFPFGPSVGYGERAEVETEENSAIEKQRKLLIPLQIPHFNLYGISAYFGLNNTTRSNNKLKTYFLLLFYFNHAICCLCKKPQNSHTIKSRILFIFLYNLPLTRLP